MNVLLDLIYILVAASGAAVALTAEPVRQAIAASLFGALLTILFLVLQAPDVALAEIAVGAAFFPLLLLLALAKSVRERSG